MVCRGGIYPSRRRLRRRRVRRDEGIPPYGRPGGCGRTGWPQHLPLAVGADSISARGGFRHRKVCGTMQASSPTKVYHNPEVAVSRLAVGPLWFVGEGFIPPAGVCAAAGSGGMRASRPTVARVVAAAPVSRSICLPCQREVARPQAVTEGLFYGQMPFQRSDVTEKFFFFELRLPGTSASFYAIPRSPLSPPLTRGPNQPANVPAAAGSGGMRASRPTVARVVAAVPVCRSIFHGL